MEKLDGRKIGPKAMEQIRTRAVKRVQQGHSPEEVIATLGFSRACIYNWLARYRAGGWDALRTGKQTGRPKKLSGSQITWIYKTVRDKDPFQHTSEMNPAFDPTSMPVRPGRPWDKLP